MVPSTYEACRDFVWGFDGFKDDRAAGENFATAYGVTQYTWGYAVSEGIVKGDIANATQADCDNILHALYWNVCRCSSMPPGANLMLFNNSVLAGAGHAIRQLQRVLGLDQDGIVGPRTIQAANSFGDKPLIDALTAADDAYLQALANAPLYLNGWMRRENDAKVLAYQMAGVANNQGSLSV
jgi:lysozyme family protein